MNDDGAPGELIFEKEIHYDKRRNEFRLDIQECGILLPAEGIFVGVSLFSENEEYRMWQSPAAPVTTKIYEEKTFLFSRNKWHPFLGIQGECRNLAIGLKVRPF